MRLLLITGGLVGSLVLFVECARGTLSADTVRTWLAGLIILQFAIALVMATNTAATSMTKEREQKTMDMLLATPLTPGFILLGKLRGLVSLTAPLVIGPVAVLFCFALFTPGTSGVPRTLGAPPMVWLETAFEVGVLMLVYTACVCVIGLRISLVSKSSVTAVMYSVGLIVLLSGTSWLLGSGLVNASQEEIGAFLAPMTPFTAVWYLVNPAGLFDSAAKYAQGAGAARMGSAIGTVVATIAYSIVVWSVYRGLVRNFAMIVRKQSGG